MTQKKQILPGVYLTCQTADKFKTSCLSVNLLARLSEDTAAKNALLPRVLSKGTSRLPDLLSLSRELDALYGAAVLPVVRRVGECQCFGFYAEFADDDFLPERAGLLEKVVSLLGEMLLHPATKGGLLRAETVSGEKADLVSEIRSQMNDKITYCARQMTRAMCKDEAYGVFKLGSEKAASAIYPRPLTHHYHRVLEQSPIELVYCGAAPQERVETALLTALADLPRGAITEPEPADVLLAPTHEGVTRVTEEMDVTQGKLTMGFRLGPCMLSPNYAAMAVFNALYGGGVTSKLFENVREKLSLCYYASSSTDRVKGLMLVSSGVKFEDFDRAEEEILRQLDDVREGNFTPDELTAARRAVITRLIAAEDSLYSLESMTFQSAVSGITLSPRELAGLCDVVTAEDVSRIARGVILDTVHYLRGRREHES